ncbi:hypothetical protein AeMF1_011699 [Aphanomyces euteiches]|nr:hypothetical protein AeMF1_011699 [Aphanomyces euteiches]KAH9196936.1 hypothetical protein AeNC1_001092 [Aphanomyces euteiches]
MQDDAWSHQLTFALNGKKVIVDGNTLPRFNELRLIDYIRDHARLTGTKLSCGEGGCGACTVVLAHRRGNDSSAPLIHRSVNSCLTPLAAVDGMAVITVEGVGSTKKGLHAIQERMVKNYSLQCGFCTPGWVMNMYELLKTTDKPTTDAIEAHFDGNLCRCTGYRPILKTMHSFGVKPSSPKHHKLEYESMPSVSEDEPDFEFIELDECDKSEETRALKQCTTTCDNCPHQHASRGSMELEDIAASPLYHKGMDPEIPAFIANYVPVPLQFEQDGILWYRVLKLEQLDEIQKKHAGKEIMFVGGLTSRGVSKYFNGTAPYTHAKLPSIFIDVNHIPELQAVNATDSLISFGAAVSLNTVITTLKASTNQYLKTFGHHVGKIANNQVRNAGTWAGNVALAKQFPAFPSDLVTALLGYGAKLVTSTKETIDVATFLTLQTSPMLVSLELPVFTESEFRTFRCHKVAQRRENSHSHVNASIMVVLNQSRVCVESTIIFGGVGPKVLRCTETEKAIKDVVVTNEVLQASLKTLQKEVASAESFKQSIVFTFWYKTILKACMPVLSSSALKSGIDELSRRISNGHQIFPTPDGSTGPVGQAIPKLSSKLLVTGEAKFVADLPPIPGLQYGALVFSTKALVRVLQINTFKAQNVKGVIDVVTAADIPGKNVMGNGDEPLFVPLQGACLYVGAALGLVLATSAQIAQEAAQLVEVEYGVLENDPFWTNTVPATNIHLAREANLLMPGNPSMANPLPMPGSDPKVQEKIAAAPRQLTGSVNFGSQRHFYMEPQGTTVYPEEDQCYRVEASTQDPTTMQHAVASLLKKGHHAINVVAKRAGGGFGGKLVRCNVNAGAAAVAAHKLNVAVQVVNDRNTDFQNVAGRNELIGEYSVGFDDEGHILALDLTMHFALGAYSTESSGDSFMAILWSDGAYHISSFRSQAYMYMSNTPPGASVRAPGVPNSIMLLEMVVEHVAQSLNKPASWIQTRNFVRSNDVTPYGQVLKNVTLQRIWDKLHASAEVSRRKEKIAVFNSNNKWKKKGIASTPVKYGMTISGQKYGAQVSIASGDGTVLLTHGGCEIGQGIDTKAAQMAAYTLGIPMDKIKLQATSTGLIPNSDSTGGSSSSESVARSVKAACETLNTRLAPIRQQLGGKASWESVVATAHRAGVQLFAGEQPRTSLPPNQVYDYYVYAAACSEVEVDILTGELNVVRTDIMYDCGKSFNPFVDIGQIEGAFVMSLGLFFQEEVVYDDKGKLLTSGTWEYKVPSHIDIPETLNVTLLEKSENPSGIMSSKAVGEPPFQLVNSVYFALKDALKHSRLERGITEFFQLVMPATVARRQLAAKLRTEDLQL